MGSINIKKRTFHGKPFYPTQFKDIQHGVSQHTQLGVMYCKFMQFVVNLHLTVMYCKDMPFVVNQH